MNHSYSILLLLIILSSCTGNEKYIGTWKALNPNNEKFEIEFKPKSISITPLNEKKGSTSYKQIGIGINCGNSRFLISIPGSKNCQITVPVKKKPKIALMKIVDEEDVERPMFSLCKDSFMSFEKVDSLLCP